MSSDFGSPVHYTAIERGTPVYDSAGVKVGEVRRVEDNYAEHILDGFEITDNDGAHRFVDAPEVVTTFERGVTLSILAASCPSAPTRSTAGSGGIGTGGGNPGGGLLGRLFGR